MDFYKMLTCVIAAEDKIYWVDSKLQTMSRINRDLTNPETIISSNIVAVEGLAVDYMSGVLS
jgi:hypothetical protein